jgi:hypothetical protein
MRAQIAAQLERLKSLYEAALVATGADKSICRLPM